MTADDQRPPPALLDEDPTVRRQAIDEVTLSPAGVLSLRDRLLLDRDATLRAAAAARLGQSDSGLAGQWLERALDDPFPSVREAICLSLGRAGRREALPALARSALEDPVWWVRRAAVRALSALAGGGDTIGLLRLVLDDPFWRVRHAAVLALALIGDHLEAQRPRLVDRSSPPPATDEGRDALAFLEARWSGVSEPERAAPSPPSRREGLDDDPAVVTAELMRAEATDLDPKTLVTLLGESHEPLRTAARRRLLELGDPEAIAEALRWLEEPRLLGAADAVTRLLDELGRSARPVVERALEAGAPLGLAWACSWIAAHHVEDLYLWLVELAEHRAPLVRARALTALAAVAGDNEGLVAPLRVALDDRSPKVKEAAVAAICRRPAEAALLDRVDFHREPPPIRLLLIEDAVRRGQLERLRQGASDDDETVAALALEHLDRAGALDDERRRRALSHTDPWVRAAALDLEAAIDALATDPDPRLRRRAASLLCRLGPELDPEQRQRAAALAAVDDDPWIRTRACALLDPEDDLERLLLLSHDRSSMVRAAARDPIERTPQLHQRLEQVLTTATTAELRRAAYTFLLRPPDAPETLRRLKASLSEPKEAPEVIAHLRTMALTIAGAAALARRPQPKTEPAAVEVPAPAEVARRRLGRSGLELAPLTLSGAFPLPRWAYSRARRAGVNTFFWEPRSATLTGFLHSPEGRDAQVIAGTFEAHPAMVQRDLERALRRLDREVIDLFLLFWARSPARLDDEAFATMKRLTDRGLVRAIGFSTHLRELAVEAIERHRWDLVMTRHSAAHPGAETTLLPAAAAAEVGVLTFSALCYGRMVRPAEPDRAPPPTAADCYRYSLSQPAVTSCISAPRSPRELAHNLAVLTSPELEGESLERVRAQGEKVYSHNQAFNRLIRRSPTRDLRRAALSLLDGTDSVGAVDGRLSGKPEYGRMEELLGSCQASLHPAVLRRG